MRKSCERVHQLVLTESECSKFEQNLFKVGALAGATAGLFGGVHAYLSGVKPEERVSVATFGKSMLIGSATSVGGGIMGAGAAWYGLLFVSSLPILIPASGLATVVSIVCGSKPAVSLK
jgi:hypothetical protein